MKVGVVGMGHVGVVAAIGLASAGHEVIGFERDSGRFRELSCGQVPFFEPGVQQSFTDVLHRGDVRICSLLEEYDERLDAVIITVGTPPLPSGGADLSSVASTVMACSTLPLPPGLIMVKSTVPPGTCMRLAEKLALAGYDASRFVFSPEFLSQGRAMEDWNRPHRIVVGVQSQDVVSDVRELFRGIETQWVVTDLTSAEIVKYAANAFLATKISFINEIANLCDTVAANIDDVVSGISLDPRIGSAFLGAGLGYGGSCFPKDNEALRHTSGIHGRDMPLLSSVIAVNERQRLRPIEVIRSQLSTATGNVTVIGLAFKPGTDDTRDSPGYTLVYELISQGYGVSCYDPIAALPSDLEGRVELFRDVSAAISNASAVIIATDWAQIRDADWPNLRRVMREPALVIDGRNCLDQERMLDLGFKYHGIGRGRVVTQQYTLPSHTGTSV